MNRKTVILLVAGAIWSTCAAGFELKGLSAGMTVRQVKAVQQSVSWQCGPVSENEHACKAVSPTGRLSTLADQRVVRISIFGRTSEEKSSEITFFLACGLPTGQLASSFIQRFGNPSDTSRNSIGETALWTWRDKDGHMILAASSAPDVCHTVSLFRERRANDF